MHPIAVTGRSFGTSPRLFLDHERVSLFPIGTGRRQGRPIGAGRSSTARIVAGESTPRLASPSLEVQVTGREWTTKPGNARESRLPRGRVGRRRRETHPSKGDFSTAVSPNCTDSEIRTKRERHPIRLNVRSVGYDDTITPLQKKRLLSFHFLVSRYMWRRHTVFRFGTCMAAAR
jgi:hypothetical protein